MKRKILAVVLMVFCTFGCFFGCGKPAYQYDPNKTQIFVSLFSGGFGNEWLQNAADAYNAASDEFEVILGDPNKDSYSQISASITSGTSRYDIYFNSTSDFIDLARQGYLEPLNDVLDMKPDGENGLTIRQKIKDSQTFIDAYSYEENGVTNTYALPFTDAMQGFVFDYELLRDKHLLLEDPSTESGLTVGRDGIEGTYDDGQPETLAEWDEMIQNIAGAGITPFIFTGKYTDYLVSMLEAMWAQYDGMKNYEISFSFEGTYKSPSTDVETPITPATGYLTYPTLEGRKVALEFMETYIANNNYVHPSGKNGDADYATAQFNFITGYKGIPENPQSAMLYEGVWWENEAKSKFDALASAGDEEMAYGNHEYRYMLFPMLDDGLGANGDGTGSIMPISESANVFIKKQSDPDKLRGAKEFLAYTCSDAVLKDFTLCSGGMRPYNYTLGETELAKLTKFQRNAYAIYTDTENVTLIRPNIMKYKSPLNYFISPAANRWGAEINDITYGEAYQGLKRSEIDANTYFDAIVAMTSQEKWENEIYGRLPD